MGAATYESSFPEGAYHTQENYARNKTIGAVKLALWKEKI